MTFSQYAGTSLVPTLARLVLAAVFIPAGWNKVFKEADFTAEQATRLRGLGVNVEAAPPKIVAYGGQWTSVQLASYRTQDAPPADAPTGSLRDPQPPEGDAQTQPSAPAEPATPPDAGTSGSGSGAATPPPAPSGPLPEGTYRAQGLHQVTLMLSENRFPYPVWMARLAAFTELIGGSMLLLGLFSRIWGLGLAIAMGVAFYLVSIKMHDVLGVDPRTLAETNPMAMATASLQLSLFVLAFGVLLTGPGPLSLDRMLFGGGREALAPGEVKLD